MRNRRLILAFIISTTLSLLVGFLSNLAATYLAPSLAGNPWLIYGALFITFVIALPVSIYLFVRSLPAEENQSSSPKPTNVTQTQPTTPGLEPQSISQLSGKGYATLIGRDGWIGDIMAALRDPGGKWIIGIDGMGGIGKTALAREVAERCQLAVQDPFSNTRILPGCAFVYSWSHLWMTYLQYTFINIDS
jgi:hypothetical protein